MAAAFAPRLDIVPPPAKDIKLLRGFLTDDDLREALDKAFPGIIDARSWAC